ncbi:DUF4097 family beta strand repeat-containing protein [Amycolatopsis sp. NPDC004079]|uniref:DUF4097 family beta strand repeat-containing protein n=1 Tax=Amycolatopsis sp. NPDC004079 TaxID=3154549 RepID=UPI0033AAE767
MRLIAHDTHTGPGVLRLRLPAGLVLVTASPEIGQAVVTLTPLQAGDPVALAAIERAEAAQTGDQLAVTVAHPGPGNRAAPPLASTLGRPAAAQAGVALADRTPIAAARADGGEIRAEARVPAGQRVEIDSDTADVSAVGPLSRVRIETAAGQVQVESAGETEVRVGNGDVDLGHVDRADVRTKRGDVLAESVRTGELETGDGRITVSVVTGPVNLRTDCGDVRAHLAAVEAQVQASTGFGDIRVTAEYGIRVDTSGLRTCLGDIQTC